MTIDDDVAQSLKNIEKHLEALVRFSYAQAKRQAFSDKTEEEIFELTGVKGQTEIRKEFHISPNTLSDLWSKWYEMGLLVKDGKGYKKTIE